MPGEVKINDFHKAEEMIKKYFANLKKLDKNFENTDGDKNMQDKIKVKQNKQEHLLGGTLRGLIVFLQSNYPDAINQLLKKEKYITNSKNSITTFEKKLIGSDTEEILKIFLDIFDLDESSPVKFKNDKEGKELNKIVSSLKKLNLDDLLDLILDDNDDDDGNKKDEKEKPEPKKIDNAAKSTLFEINELIERILKSTNLAPEKKSKKLKQTIVIAKKSLEKSSKSKKISPLLDSIDKKLDSISDDSALTKIAKILQKLLSKIK